MLVEIGLAVESDETEFRERDQRRDRAVMRLQRRHAFGRQGRGKRRWRPPVRGDQANPMRMRRLSIAARVYGVIRDR